MSNSSLPLFSMSGLLGAIFLLIVCAPACGDPAGADAPPAADGPLLWTLPLSEKGEQELELDGRKFRVGVGRSWNTESVQVELMGTHSLLRYKLAEYEWADWAVYTSALHEKEFLVRIADLDLMVLAGGPKLKPEGLWQIGPRESAEPRAKELLGRLAESRQ